MSWTSDPTRALRRRIVATCLLGAGTVAVAAAWALRTPEALGPPEVVLRPAATVAEEAEPSDTFAPAAFDVALWHGPPAPEPVIEPAPERPLPPPRLTLVAIIREPAAPPNGEHVLRAALHNPDQNKLLTVAAGESAGTWSVTRITSEGVELADGQRTTWLALRPDEKGTGR